MKTAIFAFLFCTSLHHSHAADITVSELANKMPVGQLGKPLGSRIVLKGKSPERPLFLTNPLEVSEVDGKPPATRLAIEMRGEIKIQDGVTYQLEGYESGEFSGPPDWIFNPGSPRPQSPFQYRSFFVVTKVIEPAPKLNHAARFQFRLVTDEKDANAEALPALGGEKSSVSREVLLDETSVSSAGVAEAIISLSRYLITVRFTEAGGKKFAEITRANVGHRIALVLDGEVLAEQPITEATSDFQVNTKGYGPEKAAALNKAMTEAIPASAVTKPEESPIKSSQLPADSSPQTIAAAAKMGAATAAADIKAGVFRILEYGEPRPLTEDTKDPQTGFRTQSVAGCKVTKTLLAEADAYNQAMRDWHAKNPPKP